MQNRLKYLIKRLQIKKGDHLMIHGNLAVINQISDGKNAISKLRLFIKAIKTTIGGEGVLLIPAFTYSFCKKRYFDVKNSESEVGLFSEKSREILKLRTHHPIFSFSIAGKKKEYFNCSLNECFGNKSIFKIFKKNNGKIICLGSGFNTITFLHHIEEIAQVKYRKYKFFQGNVKIHKSNVKKKVNVKYFVRKKKSIMNKFDKFEKFLERKKKLAYIDYLRFRLIKVNSANLFKQGINLLKVKPKYFI